MKKYFLIVSAVLIALASCYFAYDRYGKSLTEKVQQGVLDIDKSLKIGSAFNNYKYFKEKSWTESIDDRGRSIVTFTGVMDYNYTGYINHALSEAKEIALLDAVGLIDLMYYYTGHPVSIDIRMEQNKKEAEIIKKVAPKKISLAAKLVVSFGPSLKDRSIIITNSRVVVFNKETGEEVKCECDPKKEASILIKNVYSNDYLDKSVTTCIFSYDITPITELPEYPKDIKYLKEAKQARSK